MNLAQLPKPFLNALLITTTLTALGWAAIHPLLFGPALACTDDAAFHLLRLTQLDHLIRQGVWYSRWSPAMAQGYGFPFFNFYAPLSYYLAEISSLIVGSLYWGMRLTLALGVIGGGLAAYRLARDHFHPAAALLAAICYMYAPYQGYDIYFRGNLAESIAWPLLPLALWSMGRLARSGQRHWLAAATLSYGAVLLTHNVFALIFSPLLALYAAAETFGHCSPEQRWRRLTQCGLSFMLALCLTAFFWWPAMAEQQYVHIDRLLVPPVFVYWHNFITLGEIFTLPHTIYPDLLNPSPARGLGLVPFLVALPGLGGVWLWRWSEADRGRQRQVLFFAGTLLIYIFLMTNASAFLWANLPLLPFVQFPWRLLGPAALCLAMVAAATGQLCFPNLTHSTKAGEDYPTISHLAKSGRLLVIPLLATLLILSSLFWFYPRYCPGLENPTIADIPLFEQATVTIGTTAKGEYLPRTVVQYPPVPPFAPLPFAPETLPEGVQIIRQDAAAVGATAILQTAESQVVRVNIFAYPGWQVHLNGQPTPITPDPTFGLIHFTLPAGQHEVTIRFRETPLRRATNLLSLGALLAVIGYAWPQPVSRKLPSGKETERGESTATFASPLPLFPSPYFLWFLLWGGMLTGFIVWGLPRWSTPLLRLSWQHGQVHQAAVPLPTDFAGGLHLSGYTLSQETVRSGERLRVDLFWTPYQPPQQNFQSTVTLVDEQGYLWSDKQSEPPRDWRPFPPTSVWQPGDVAQDSHWLELLPGTPPGVYTVRLVLFDRESLQPMPRLTNPAHYLALGQITVSAAKQDAAAFSPQYAADHRWGPLRLFGYNLDRAEAAPGSPFLFTVFWETVEPSSTLLAARLRLLSPTGQVAWETLLPPAAEHWPTTSWQPGERWQGQQGIRLPASLESGRYTWELALCQPQNGACIPVAAALHLGELTIYAPERLWELPPLLSQVDALLGEMAILSGVTNLPEQWLPGETVTVGLVWGAAAEIPHSYHVFLQLLGPGGQLIAQSDGEPAHWTRPTTGWLPGEIILDEHTLTLPSQLPPGEYTVVAGLYLPETGQRLTQTDGRDAVPLIFFTLGE